MATNLNVPTLNPNDDNSVLQHQRAVFARYSDVFAAIDRAVAHAVPTGANLFGLLSGPRDRAFHAMSTRYIARTVLSRQGVDAQDEPLDAELEWAPNCGICVHVPGAEIRVLKSSNGTLPKSGSAARSRFYSSNQLWLFPDEFSIAAPSLKLVALWDIDEDFAYTGLEIACPQGELEDRTVDCFWKSVWSSPVAVASPREANTEDGDLDIRPIESASEALADR